MDLGSTWKFSILEGGTCVRRGKMVAMVGSVEPARVFSQGHYFEVRVKLARSPGRTAGLVLGFKASPCGEEDASGSLH